MNGHRQARRRPDGRERVRRLEHARRIRRRRFGAGSLVAAFLAAFLIVVFHGLTSGSGPSPAGESSRGTGAADPESVVGRKFTVSTTGDILIHSPVWADALIAGGGDSYDFTPMFEPIRRYLDGSDLAICHVETPITTGEPSGYPIFSAPADLAVSIHWAGWDACDTASNHSLDQGQAGIDETGRLLDRAQVRHTGSAASAREAETPLVLMAGPARVGILAYTDATNGIPSPHPWSVNLLAAGDPPAAKAARVAADVKRSLAAGADTVLVIIQWGDENSSEPNPSQRALARKIVAIDGVAAIAGQGPHTVQPIERIGGRFVIFSVGNLLSNQSALAGLPASTQDGMIALLDFVGTEQGYEVRRVRYVPIMVDLSGHLVLPTGSGSRIRPEAAGALAESWQRTVDVAGRGPGVKPVPANHP